MHLHYSDIGAGLSGENRHPQIVMRELGITYTHATPQSIVDSWWFWNCQHLPEHLPKYLRELTVDPMQQIGNGLSPEKAADIVRLQQEINAEEIR